MDTMLSKFSLTEMLAACSVPMTQQLIRAKLNVFILLATVENLKLSNQKSTSNSAFCWFIRFRWKPKTILNGEQLWATPLYK